MTMKFIKIEKVLSEGNKPHVGWCIMFICGMVLRCAWVSTSAV